MRLNQDFISSVLPETIFLGGPMPAIEGFSVDSRTIRSEQVFVAIKGKNVDGHDYLQDAINNGAAGAIISKNKQDALAKLKNTNNFWIAIVNDSYHDTIKLASFWRKNFSIPVIAITGSVGKTSTKEIICNILSSIQKPYIASYGNQNTAIGLALNILRMHNQHEVAVFEMGISRVRRVARMADLVRPTIAIITYIGHSHLEGLGGLNGIAIEKRDIFKYFQADNIGIINGDIPLISANAYNHPIIKFGLKTANQIQARRIKIEQNHTKFTLKIYKNKFDLELNTTNTSVIYAILAASAACKIIDIKDDHIAKGVLVPLKVSGRFDLKELKNYKGFVINDAYNASPESMKAALLAFQNTVLPGKKIAVIGDMLELGAQAPFWHRQIGRFLRKITTLDHVIFVGSLVSWAKKTLPSNISCQLAVDWQEALNLLKQQISDESVILIKGSRAIKLDKLVDEIAK